MSNVITDNQYYTAIANAIRSKLSSQDTFTPSEMAAAIQSISSGGGGSTSVGMTVDEWHETYPQYPVKITFHEMSIPSYIFRKNLNYGAVSMCQYLTTLAYEGTAQNRFIGERAMTDCNSLTTLLPSPEEFLDGVTSIGAFAFEACSGLTTLVFPDSLTSLGNKAFQNCTGLTSLVYGKNITTEGVAYQDIFGGAGSLDGFAVTFPNGMVSIPVRAICGSRVSSITFPSSGLTTIALSAFQACTKLTSVSLPSGLTLIGDSAFAGCTALTTVTLPNTLTTIGNRAFEGCSALTAITIPASVNTIGHAYNDAFGGAGAADGFAVTFKSGRTDIPAASLAGSKVTSVSIPSGVTTIGASAFYNCDYLTSISFPASVVTFNDRCCEGCAVLADVYILANSATFGNNPFMGMATGSTIHVKNQAVADALAGKYTTANTTIAIDA